MIHQQAEFVQEVHGSQGPSSHSNTKHKFKKLMIKKSSKSSLRRCTKFGQAHLNDVRNNTFTDFAFYIGFLGLIWVTSSAENIHLARKGKLIPE